MDNDITAGSNSTFDNIRNGVTSDKTKNVQNEKKKKELDNGAPPSMAKTIFRQIVICRFSDFQKTRKDLSEILIKIVQKTCFQL